MQHLRMFLIIAMVLSPVQHLFAVQAAMQTDDPTVVVETVAASDMAQNGVLIMLDEDCGKHGNCQDSNQCGNCPLSLRMSPMTRKRAEVNKQIQAISDVSLYSADLLPDYRPPRYS